MEEFWVIASSVAAIIRGVVAVAQFGMKLADRRKQKRNNPPSCGSQTDRRIS
jgi:hypothetical protein